MCANFDKISCGKFDLSSKTYKIIFFIKKIACANFIRHSKVCHPDTLHVTLGTFDTLGTYIYLNCISGVFCQYSPDIYQ